MANLSHFSVPYSHGGDLHKTSHLSVAMTVGITEEMQDSVHSLSPKHRGYYEWKQDQQNGSGKFSNNGQNDLGSSSSTQEEGAQSMAMAMR